MNFIILEMQTNAEGATACLVDAFSDRQKAEQKYHDALSHAAVSGLPVHSVMMLTNTGRFLKEESYTNQA